MTDKVLSQHFTLYQFLHTDRVKFQAMNREVTKDHVTKLAVLAAKVEEVYQILGGCHVTSAYRCPDLNDAVGSTPRSQHLLAEAADLVPFGEITEVTVSAAFNRLVFEATKGNINFGQLIKESQKGRDGNYIAWLHISLGEPYRPIEKCGQILVMKDGKYSLVGKV